MDYDDLAPILTGAGMAQASGEPLELDQLAVDTPTTAEVVVERVNQVDDWGLIIT